MLYIHADMLIKIIILVTYFRIICKNSFYHLITYYEYFCSNQVIDIEISESQNGEKDNGFHAIGVLNLKLGSIFHFLL